MDEDAIVTVNIYTWHPMGPGGDLLDGVVCMDARDWERAKAALLRLRTVADAIAKPPYPDSDPASLLETLRVQAQDALEGGEG